jgi:hypothetical protein
MLSLKNSYFSGFRTWDRLDSVVDIELDIYSNTRFDT